MRVWWLLGCGVLLGLLFCAPFSRAQDTCSTLDYFNVTRTPFLELNFTQIALNLSLIQSEFTVHQKCRTHFTRCGYCIQQPPCNFCETEDHLGCVNPAFSDLHDDIVSYKLLQLARAVAAEGFADYLAVPATDTQNTGITTQATLDTDFLAGSDVTTPYPNYVCCPDLTDTWSDCTISQCSNVELMTYLCMSKLWSLKASYACSAMSGYTTTTDCSSYLGAPYCGEDGGWDTTAACSTLNYASGCGCDQGFFAVPAYLFVEYGLDDQYFDMLELDTATVTTWSQVTVSNSIVLLNFTHEALNSCPSSYRVDGENQTCAVYKQNVDVGMRIEIEHWETCFDYLTSTFASTAEDYAVEDTSFEWAIKPIPYDITQTPCCTLCCCPSRRWNETFYLNGTEEVAVATLEAYSTTLCTDKSELCPSALTQSDDSDSVFGRVSLSLVASGTVPTMDNSFSLRLYASTSTFTNSTLVQEQVVNVTQSTYEVEFVVSSLTLSAEQQYWTIVPLNGTEEYSSYRTVQRIRDAYARERIAIYPRNLPTNVTEINGVNVTYSYFVDDLGITHTLTAENGYLGGAHDNEDVFGFVHGNAGLCPDVTCEGVYCTDDYVCPFISCDADALSCPNFNTCKGGTNQLSGGLADQTPLTFVVGMEQTASGTTLFDLRKLIPYRTCSSNSTAFNGSSSQPFCDAFGFNNLTLNATLLELWEMGLYWDDAFVNPIEVPVDLTVPPAPHLSATSPNGRYQKVMDNIANDFAEFNAYYAKMLEDDEDEDDPGSSTINKQDTTTTTTTTTTTSDPGTSPYDCGPDHVVCSFMPFSFCNTTASPIACECLEGFGSYANGCEDVEFDPNCGDHSPLVCATVKYFLNRDDCIVEEADEIDLDCARSNMTVLECMQSNFPFRYRNFDQFVPPADDLNPNTIFYLRGLPFASQGEGWVLAFQETHTVSSGSLECECEGQGIRCACTALDNLGNDTFVFVDPTTVIVNGTVVQVQVEEVPVFERFTVGRSNGIEDDQEGATPFRGPTLTRRGWTEVVTLACSKCLSLSPGGMPEVLSKVCDESFISICQSMEGALRWPICSYCAIDQVGSGRNTSNVDSQVTHYNNIELKTKYHKFAVDEWEHDSKPPSTQYDPGEEWKTQRRAYEESQLLKYRDQTLQNHVTTMTVAAELAAKMNRWAGYNYENGGYLHRTIYGKHSGAYEDIDLTNIAKTFCPMIFQQFYDAQQSNTNGYCFSCKDPYVGSDGQYSNATRWACEFCVQYQGVDEERQNDQGTCLDYTNLHTDNTYADLQTALGFSTTITDNKLLRLESDILGFWRWCESDDHLQYLYGLRGSDGYLPSDASPWGFSNADACEQSRFSFNPIPDWSDSQGDFLANPLRPILYKKWWSESDATNNPADPSSAWYGWTSGNDQLTLETTTQDKHSLFWGIAQGTNPTEAQGMGQEQFMSINSLFDIDLSWYGFPHNPWRCLEYEDMLQATIEEFTRNRDWEDKYKKSPDAYRGYYVYWCGVCNADMYCTGTEGTSDCPCYGGTDDITGEVYGFEDYCNPFTWTQQTDGTFRWVNTASATTLVNDFGRSLCPKSTPLRTTAGYDDLHTDCNDNTVNIVSLYQDFAPSRTEQPSDSCATAKKSDEDAADKSKPIDLAKRNAALKQHDIEAAQTATQRHRRN